MCIVTWVNNSGRCQSRDIDPEYLIGQWPWNTLGTPVPTENIMHEYLKFRGMAPLLNLIFCIFITDTHTTQGNEVSKVNTNLSPQLHSLSSSLSCQKWCQVIGILEQAYLANICYILFDICIPGTHMTQQGKVSKVNSDPGP